MLCLGEICYTIKKYFQIWIFKKYVRETCKKLIQSFIYKKYFDLKKIYAKLKEYLQFLTCQKF